MSNETVHYSIPHGGIGKIPVEMLEEDIGSRFNSPKQITVALKIQLNLMTVIPPPL